jgi:hypothetical protein
MNQQLYSDWVKCYVLNAPYLQEPCGCLQRGIKGHITWRCRTVSDTAKRDQ